MFTEASEVVSQAVDAVYALTMDLDRGQMLTHAAIREVIGLEPHVGMWDHVVRKALKRLLKERGIACWPNIRDGYELCTVQRQLELPVEWTRRGLRRVKAGRVATEQLPDAALTLHQRRLKAFRADQSRASERELRRKLASMRRHAQPLHPRPNLAAVGT